MEEIMEEMQKNQAQENKTGCGAPTGIMAHFYMDNRETLTGLIPLAAQDVQNQEALICNYRQQLSFVSLGKESDLEHYGPIACFGSLCVDMRHCIGFEVEIFPSSRAKQAGQARAKSTDCCAADCFKGEAGSAASGQKEAAAVPKADTQKGEQGAAAGGQNTEAEENKQSQDTADAGQIVPADSAFAAVTADALQTPKEDGVSTAAGQENSQTSPSANVPKNSAQAAILPESSQSRVLSAAEKEAADRRLLDELHAKTYRLRALGLAGREEVEKD